jgi:hypothetical protein
MALIVAVCINQPFEVTTNTQIPKNDQDNALLGGHSRTSFATKEEYQTVLAAQPRTVPSKMKKSYIYVTKYVKDRQNNREKRHQEFPDRAYCI